MQPSQSFELAPVWPQPDESGRCVLQPDARSLVKSGGRLLLTAAVGAVLIVAPHLPQPLRVKGYALLIVGGGLGLWLLYRAQSGAFILTLYDNGFTLGKARYAWTDIGSFMLGSGRQRQSVTFTVAGKRKILANMYGVTAQQLADFMNSHLPRTNAEIATSPGASVRPTQVARRTLPPLAWGLIIALFIVLIKSGGPIAEALWRIFTPVSYASKMLNDQDLTDEAGHDPALLRVLQARADAGDKSAMYHMGDIYDPTDFICETAVPKNAATAVYWYQRAVPLDDQGAERALGYLYHEGIGVPQDDVMAASLLERAVAHNDDFGDYYLGQMLETGAGEPQNLPRAVQLEQASAAQGNDLGETELGRMYFNGIGVSHDATQAATYWKQAAAQGNTDAKNLLAQNGLQ